MGCIFKLRQPLEYFQFLMDDMSKYTLAPDPDHGFFRITPTPSSRKLQSITEMNFIRLIISSSMTHLQMYRVKPRIFKGKLG